MAAVMITDQPARPRRHVTGTGPRRPGARLVAVPDPTPRVRPTARASAATFRRRRLGALVGVAAVVFVAGRAGAALGSEPLAAPGRGPSVTRYVVHGGDTLWSAAHHLAPDADPREVVDALIEARGGGALMPGEVLRWQR
jgi:nucleoid-associated protein YgaU